MTRVRPFSFDEFGEPAPPAETPRGRTSSAEDLAAARAEGVAEGRRLAMESIAAHEIAALDRIGAALDAAKEGLKRDAPHADLLAAARLFLEDFGAGLAAAREVEIADDLLRRLVENSEDRRAASLRLNPRSLARLGARLAAVIEKRGVADFVTLEEDAALDPGEARLEWRGGELRRGRAEIRAALAAIFDPLQETEPRS